MANPRDQIITLPTPSLRRHSKKVGLVDKSITRIINNMQAALLDWEASREHEVGVALAAIQINQSLRIVIIRNDFNNKEDRTYTIFINPTITKYEGNIEEDFEGCLSVKDIYGKVPRYTKIKVKAQNLNGKEFRVTADGFLARTFQHEIDHTNGVLFVDHIKDNSEAFFKLNDEGNLEQLDDKDIQNHHIFR